MPLAISTGDKLGLGIVAAVFIAFALASALVIPRYRPDFPGRGLAPFIVATVILFAAMMGAVELFGAEEETGHEPAATETTDRGEAETGED